MAKGAGLDSSNLWEAVLAVEVAVFKADYSVNLRRCRKTNAIVALGEYLNSSVLGIRSY